MSPLARLLVVLPLASLVAGSSVAAGAPPKRPPANRQLPPPPALTGPQLLDRSRELILPRLERGDAELAGGRPDAALGEYLEARLLLLPGDQQGAIDVALRIAMAEATLGHCDQARRAIRPVQSQRVLSSDPSRTTARTQAYWTIESLCGR